jgi:ubiquinone biosynthesis protein COQ9
MMQFSERFPERSPQRDQALEALLARVPEQGWTMPALRAALREIGMDPLDAELLFPGGMIDAIEAFIDLADRWMEQDAQAAGLSALRLPQRVRAVIVLRLTRLAPHREAVRRALGILALPRHARIAACATARTVDAIWHASGDRSADFSWYTKRATLTGVYVATLMVWLRDESEDHQATLAFLDRRLAGVARFGKLRHRVEEALCRLRPASGAA